MTERLEWLDSSKAALDGHHAGGDGTPGCGGGHYAVELARRGFAVTDMDRSAELLAEARGRVSDAGLMVTLIEADLFDVPDLAEGRLYMRLSAEEVLNDIARVLSKPTRRSYHLDRHVRMESGALVCFDLDHPLVYFIGTASTPTMSDTSPPARIYRS